jgi:hypothetical protein
VFARTNEAYSGPVGEPATLRNLAISLLYLNGVTEITRTLQAISRNRTGSSTTYRYETQFSNDFGDHREGVHSRGLGGDAFNTPVRHRCLKF